MAAVLGGAVLSRGLTREHRVADDLRDDGYDAGVIKKGMKDEGVSRLGAADVIAVKPGEVLLVQVKSTKGGPYAHFGPADRRVLLDAAERVGARAVLAHWPPRGKLHYIPSSLWPSA